MRTTPQEHGKLERLHGELVLTTQGTPYEEGFQHGYLLREEIRSCYHEYFETRVFPAVPVLPAFFHVWQARNLVKAFSADEMAELRGMAAGSDLPLDQLLVMQAPPAWASLASRLGEPRATRLSGGTSAFFVKGRATLGGAMLLGANCSGFDFGERHRYAILRVHQPKKGYAYVAPGSAGSILETPVGWNERGLAIAALDSRERGTAIPALSAAQIGRRLLQTCATPGDAEQELRAGGPGNAAGQAFLVAKSNEAQIMELAPLRAEGKTSKQTLMVRTVRAATSPPDALYAASSGKLSKLLADSAGRIDFSRALELLTDTTEPEAGIRGASDRGMALEAQSVSLHLGPLVLGTLGKMTTFASSLWDLKEGQLYLAHGHELIESPAQYVNFDLMALLQRPISASATSSAFLTVPTSSPSSGVRPRPLARRRA